MSLVTAKVPADASAATDLSDEAVVTSHDPRGAGPARGAVSLVDSAHPWPSSVSERMGKGPRPKTPVVNISSYSAE